MKNRNRLKNCFHIAGVVKRKRHYIRKERNGFK